MKIIKNYSRSLLLGLFITLSLSSQAQLVQMQGATIPGPPATSCTNTFVDAAVLLLCINIQFNGANVTTSGSNITVDLDYSLGPICLGALSNVTENVNMGMLPAGTYTVTVNGNLNGTFASSTSTTVSVASCCSATPAFTATMDTVCPGDSVYFNNTSTGGVSNTWFVNNSLVSSSTNYGQPFPNAGTYNVKLVVDATGCSDSITKPVYVIASSNCCPVNPGFTASATSACSGDSVYFTNNSVGATSQTWYVGSNAVGTGTDYGQVFTAAGSYTISLVASDGSCSDSISQTIQVTNPSVNLGPDSTICPDATILLVAGFSYDSVLWSDGSTGSTLNVGVGTHFVEVYLAGCPAYDTVVVSAITVAPANLGADTAICVGDSLILDATRSGASYMWQDNSTAASFTVSAAGMYWVVITEANGCTTSDTVSITVDSCGAGMEDYINQQLAVYPQPARQEFTVELTNGFDLISNLRIVNMSGQVVLEQNLRAWNGSIQINSGNLPEGVYVLQLSGESVLVNRSLVIKQ